ncbi:hypothetical protein [Limnobacter sp.]|uniref:hypothetical protein n=1 Tax=Limnobacter sp. TaxID=2003368 RepID=UPI00391DE741
MRNIEIFKAISALVMADLYAHFPLKQDISPSELALNLGDELWDKSLKQDSGHPNVYERQRQFSPAALARPTIEWLANAGLISYSSYQNSKFKDVALTLKGLESIEAHSTRGKRLINASKNLLVDSAKDAAKEQLTKIAGEMFKWCVKEGPQLIHLVQNYGQQ